MKLRMLSTVRVGWMSDSVYMVNSLDKLERILMLEASFTLEHNLSITATKVKNARKRLLTHVKLI